MKQNNRMIRVNDEIMRELSRIFRNELKDPRVSAMTSVTKVDTTSDFKYCKVWVSIMGDEKSQGEVMEGIKSASGFIRKCIAGSVNLRHTPEFTFVLDDSLEYSDKIAKLIKEVNKDRE